MKFNELKSIGHNIADSLTSGIGLPIGIFTTDIFGEAARSPDGYVVVDFLNGVVEGDVASTGLREAIRLYRLALTDLCLKHGGETSAFKALKVRFGSDVVYGPHFTVTVEDHNGRRSVDQYRGFGGHRIRTLRSQSD